MKRERLIVLLGVLVALVFFYLGLNEWMKSKEEKTQPPPVVVNPPAVPPPPPPAVQPPAPPAQEQVQPPPEKREQDQIAQKIKEELKEEKKERPEERKRVVKAPQKTYTVQIGAFINREGAEKVASKARRLGYRVSIVEEDNFYKVRLSVTTSDIQSELAKLRSIFGGAILK